ncbi:MAG: TraR/DksA C4-type zinc finger protein [Actinobacteria bacterium]|nr:TraR/DksA C4-type zinc finger protein [Actinomycetota bacterium]
MAQQREHAEEHARLEEQLSSIDSQLHEQGASIEGDEVEVSVDEGFADSAHATAERSELISHMEQLHAHRAEVWAALERLDAGVYGICERCGDEIGPERLEAMPAARLCMSCKQAEAVA